MITIKKNKTRMHTYATVFVTAFFLFLPHVTEGAVAFKTSNVLINNNDVTAPAGIVSGDLLLVHHIYYDRVDPVITPPAGWTEFRGPDCESTGSIACTSVFYKISDGSDTTGTSYTFTEDVENYSDIILLVYSGVNRTNPFDSASSANTGASGTRTATGITTSYPNEMLILLSAGFGGAPTSLPTGMTLRLTMDSVNTVYEQSLTTPGATGDRTHTQSDSSAWVATLIALRPSRQMLTKPPNNLGLVGYWSFNEGSGSNTADVSGNGNTATFTSLDVQLPEWTTGKIGGAISLSGAADGGYAQVNPLSSNSRLTSVGSVAVWFKCRANPASNLKLVGNISGGLGYDLRLDSSGRVVLSVLGNFDGSNVTSSGSYCDSRWHHAIGVWGGSNIDLYVDGASAATTQPLNDSAFSRTYLSMGVADDLAFVLNGLLDEVRIYNRALTAADAAKLYQSGAVKVGASSADLDNGSTLERGLVGHWTFDGGDFTDKAYDRSGQGNHGYLVLNTATSTHKSIGKFGQAFDTKGNAEINVGSASSIDNISPLTVCMWEKLTTVPSAFVNFFDASDSADGVNGWNFYYIPSALGGPGLGLYTNSGDYAENYTLSTSGWQHICGTWDGSNPVAGSPGIKLYMNGQLVSNTAEGVAFGSDQNDSTHNKTIGGYGFGTPISDAQYDDVRLYNRVLSATEVKQLYNLGQAKIR